MPSIYVTEYASAGQERGELLQTPRLPYIATHKVAIGSGSAATPAFNAQTTIIRVHTDAKCSIRVGTAPVATVSDPRMAADSTEYFCVAGGLKLAVIENNT